MKIKQVEVPATPDTIEYLSQLNDAYASFKLQLISAITALARQQGITEFALHAILSDKVILNVPEQPEGNKEAASGPS